MDLKTDIFSGRKLSVVIPCWNEKNTIKEIIARVKDVSIPGWSVEIVIVDDFSTDGTREILKGYEQMCSVIYREKNGGKGSAVKNGIERATGDYILIQDADLEYNPKEIPDLVREIKDSKTIVYGSRNLNSNKNERKTMIIPRIGVWFITKEFNFLFSTRLTDIWTCYKLFPKEAGVYFTSGHFESELSFSAKVVKNGYKIVEVPISHKPRQFEEGKKITYLDGIKGILTILKERFTN
jgi:glycosyltransferase involved in cell wall biosynthesis